MARKGDEVAARGDGPPHGRGGRYAAGGALARAPRGQRWLARLAFAAAFAAVVVLLLSGALRSVAALLVGFAGLAITCTAAWWFLAKADARAVTAASATAYREAMATFADMSTMDIWRGPSR